MADQKLINQFKEELLSQGINWDDNKINNYITLRQAGENVAVEMQEEAIQKRDKQIDMFSSYRPDATPKIPQKEKNAMWDFTGNLLWEAMDSATFGSLGWADWTDPIEEAMTGGGPETFAGRVGAGLGGFAGFLVPMTGTAKALSAGARAMKGGTKYASKQLLKEGTAYLGTKGPIKLKDPLTGEISEVIGKGYKRFNNMSGVKRTAIFKPFMDDITEFGARIGHKEVRDAYKARFGANLQKSIAFQLKKAGIRPTNQNTANIEAIIKRAAGVSKNSSLPIWSLEQKIKIALGSTIGAGKTASIAATSLAEGLTFAAVETPFELFQSMEEGREADYLGRAKHAFILGNALGLIKYIPGGKQFKEGGILRAGLKRWNVAKKKRPYIDYDMSLAEDRKALMLFGKSIYKRSGGQLFEDKAIKLQIPHSSHFDFAASSRKGAIKEAKKIKEAMTSIEKEFLEKWLPLFSKEAAEDLVGSVPRMIMGSMAFNHEVVLDDHIPLEDKVFHTLLGAWMTKRGKVLEYTNVSGGKKEYIINDYNRPSDEFTQINDYLNELGIDPMNANFRANVIDQDLAKKYTYNIKKTDDVQAIEKIVKSAVVQDSGVSIPQPKNGGKSGMSPIYEYMRAVYDRQIGLKDGTRMKAPEEMTLTEIKQIEKKLKKHDFESIIEEGGIDRLSKIDDIFYAAADKNMQKLINEHVEAAIAIYNHLAKSNVIVRSDDSKVLPELYNIIPIKNGKKVSGPNQELANTYARIISALDGRFLTVNKDKGRRLSVEDNDFKGLGVLIDGFESKVNGLIYGDDIPTRTRTTKLAQEGMTYELMVGQSFFKGIRNLHARLNDPTNSKNTWRVDPARSESGISDGEILFGYTTREGRAEQGLITELLYDNNGNLYKTLEFGKSLSESNKQMLSTLHKILSADPNKNFTMLDSDTSNGIITQDNISGLKTKVEALRSILYENGLQNLIYNDSFQARQFIGKYQDYAFKTFLKSSVKRNGEPLNEYDRNQISSLLDYGLLGPNFQLTDIIGIVEHLQSLADTKSLAGLSVKAGALFDGKKPFTYLESDFAKLDGPVGLKRSMKALEANGIKTPEQIEMLLKTYKEIIEPLMIDPNNPGVGLIKPGEAIAQVSEGQLSDLIFRLDTLNKQKDNLFHDNLLTQLQNIKDSKDPNFNEMDREMLNYLYSLYGTGRASTSKLIQAMAERKLYKFDKNEVVIDPQDKGLREKLKEIVEDIEFDMVTQSDALTLENKINKFKTFESKDSELSMKQSITKQSLISKYDLPKNVKFEKKDIEDVLDHAKITRADHSTVWFRDNRRAPSESYELMNDSQQTQLLFELAKVYNTGLGSKVITRLKATEGYGVWSQQDYIVSNNHYFEALDKLVGKGNWSMLDLEMGNKQNGISNARTDSKAKQHLYHMIYTKTKGIDPNLRKDNKIGNLIHERGSGSVPIDIPGVKWSVAVSREALRKLGPKLNEKLEEFKKQYSAPKYRDLHRELTKHFKNIVETKDVSGKKEFIWKESDAFQEGESLGTILNFMNHDSWMKKWWWEHAVEVHNNKNDLLGVKLARRLKMFANTGMRMLSNEQLDFTVNLLEKNITNKNELKKNKAYIGLKKLRKNNGMRIALARDENFELGGRQFSILKELKAQIESEANNTKLLGQKFLQVVEKDGELTFAGGKDISKVDSYMVVEPSVLDGLLGLNGAGHIAGTGGIKPMIHRTGDGIILGKTAFVTDPKMVKFFKANKLDGLLMESGAKIMNENTKIFTEFDSMESLSKKILSNDFKELLELKDLSLGAVVKPNGDATLPHQISNHLNKKEGKALYDNYLSDNLTEFVNDTQNYFNTADPLAGLAQAKMMSSSGMNIDNTSVYSRWIKSNGFIHSQIVSSDFIRQVKSSRIDNGGIMSMKTKYGGQAVNSPGEDLRFTTFLEKENRNGDISNEIYTHGQMEMARIHGDKRVDLKNLTIIEYIKDNQDKVFSYKELLNENLKFDKEIYEVSNKVKMMEDPIFIAKDGKARDVWVVDNIKDAKAQLALIKAGLGKGKNFTKIKKKEDGYYILEHKKGDDKHIYIRSKKPYKKIFQRLEEDPAKTPGMYTKSIEIGDNISLYEAYSKLNQLSKENNRTFEVATVVRRNPSTRPGDMAVVGLKGFLDKGYGNQTKLNAADWAFRLEGDYDIDKSDFFWDTPTEVLNKWRDLSGEVIRVNPDTYASGDKTSLRRKNSSGLVEKFDWLNPASIDHWDRNLATSEKLRGTIVKMQRTLAALENYDSASNFIIGRKDGKQRGGFALNLKNVENGGWIYLSQKVLKEQRKLLAQDIQNITDSLTGYNDRVYNENWKEDFLFGNHSGRYDGIFKRATYDEKQKIWTEHPVQGLKLTVTERSIIQEAIRPYDAMLQLGTSLFRNGKQENVRYEDLLSGMALFDMQMANLSESVYWKLKKRGTAKTKIDKTELDKYFINKTTKKVENIFGDFGTNIRPGLLAHQNRKIADQFDNMLPFERAMAVLVNNDYMKIELPGKIQGDMLAEFNKFYSENMFGENFDAVGRKYIEALQANDKMFGYANYLSYNIGQQQTARRNALKNNHTSLAEVINDNLINLKAQKKEIEQELIFGEKELEGDSQGMIYAQKLRDGVRSLYINDLYKNGKLPKDWNKFAKPRDMELRSDQRQDQHFDNSTPEGKAKITAFVSSNSKLFRNYANKKGVIKFEGVSDPKQLDLIINHNNLSKYLNIGIRDIYTGGDKAIEMDQDINNFLNFYSKEWRTNLSGSDFTMDATRTRSIITDNLEILFEKWQVQGKATDDGGHGMLFLLKLMAPREKENTFTYLHGRIAPAYKTQSSNIIRLASQFIASAKESHITEITKTAYFDHMSRFFNNSFRAIHGHKPEGSNFMFNQMSNKLMETSDVFNGAPLIDNIKGWQPSYQETHLNDNLALLFGSRESLTGIFGGSIVDPSVAGRAASLMRYAYSPVSYIPESTNIMNHPSINGFKNYKEAIEKDNSILLGNSKGLNLLFNRTPKLEPQAYQNIKETGSNRGYDAMLQKLMNGCKKTIKG